MITIRKEQSIAQSLQNSQALMSVKNYVDYSKFQALQGTSRSERVQKFKQVFIKTKAQKITQVFAQKILRVIDSDDYIMQKIWNQQKQTRKYAQGFVYPQKLQHILQVINIICFPVLIILSCFLGFLDQFSALYANNFLVLTIQIFCLLVTVSRFVIKSTSKTYGGGEEINQIYNIIATYFYSGRLVFDLVLIILQFSCIISQQNTLIDAILFFYLNFVIIFLGNDTFRIEAAYVRNRKTAMLLSLLKIMFFNLFFAHFMATILLSMSKIQPEHNWMVRAGVSQKQWYIQYVTAYYWGTTIMMTVGFGDILPGQENWKEMLVTSFVQMISCVVLGYNISSIGNIVSKLRDSQQNINKKLIVFERMMKNHRQKSIKIDPKLQKKISNYLQELRIDKDNLQYIQRDQLLEQLPQHLRKAYFKQANKRLFQKVMFFQNLKSRTLQILAQKFKSTFYYYQQKLYADEQVLILQKGKVGLSYYKRGSTYNDTLMQVITVKQNEQKILLNGSNFLTFSHGQQYNLITKQQSMVWSIQLNEFIQILGKCQLDLQYYYSILHKHPLDQNQWEFIQCKRCSLNQCKRFHSIFYCSKATYMPIRSIISQIYMSDRIQVCQTRNQKYVRERSKLVKKLAIKWKKQFRSDYQKVKLSKSFIRRSSKRMSFQLTSLNFHKQQIASSNTINILQNLQPTTIDEQQLKKLIKQVLFQHETGYQQGYWVLESDIINDYQFYFPLDNANKLFMTSIDANPRKLNHGNSALALACKLRTFAYLN